MNFKIKKKRIFAAIFVKTFIWLLITPIFIYEVLNGELKIEEFTPLILTVSLVSFLYLSEIIKLIKHFNKPVLILNETSLDYHKFKILLKKDQLKRVEIDYALLNSCALVFPKIEISVKWYQLKKKRLLKKYGTDLLINLDELEGEEKENFELINKWLTND